MTGEWLAYCSPCPVPEIANVFIRNKIPFHQVSQRLRLEAASSDVQQRLDALRNEFDVQPDCNESDLLDAARTSVALDQLVQRYRLGALAYYYKCSGLAENEATMSSIILGTSRLTGQGVPVAGEYEVKMCWQ
jgi:L-arabinose isomerase